MIFVQNAYLQKEVNIVNKVTSARYSPQRADAYYLTTLIVLFYLLLIYTIIIIIISIYTMSLYIHCLALLLCMS